MKDHILASRVEKESCKGCTYDNDGECDAPSVEHVLSCVEQRAIYVKKSIDENESECFDREWDVRMKQQIARVNPSNREKAIIDAGNAVADCLFAYATTQTEVGLVKAWKEAVQNG